MEHKIENRIYRNEGNNDVLELVPKDAKFILDIGCGDGSLASILTNENRVIDGITISNLEAAIARDYCENVYVHNLESGLPPELRSKLSHYDCVICSHVLEHLCQPDELLSDINRVLKTDGVLLVAVPNLMHIASRLNILAGNFVYTQSGLMDSTHYKWYTINSIRVLMNKFNFNILAVNVTGEIPLVVRAKIFKNTLFYLWIKNVLLTLFPGLFGYQIIIKVKK